MEGRNWTVAECGQEPEGGEEKVKRVERRGRGEKEWSGGGEE